MKKKPKISDVTFFLPTELIEKINSMAKENNRSLDNEVTAAFEQHIKQGGMLSATPTSPSPVKKTTITPPFNEEVLRKTLHSTFMQQEAYKAHTEYYIRFIRQWDDLFEPNFDASGEPKKAIPIDATGEVIAFIGESGKVVWAHIDSDLTQPNAFTPDLWDVTLGNWRGLKGAHPALNYLTITSIEAIKANRANQPA